MKFGLGQNVSRVEDWRFLTGNGRYTDDMELPHQAYCHVLRAPVARAEILKLDKNAAEAAPGVLAVLSGEDVAADGLGDLPCLAASLVPLQRPDGAPIYVPPRPLLLKDRVAFAGDYVALVVAESLAEAVSAAELVEVDYDEQPANTSTVDALADETPAVWPECPDNVCFAIEMGDSRAVEAAFAEAHHIARCRIPVSRIAQNPMEPRAALGQYDPASGRYTLISGCQNPHDLRQLFAEAVFRIRETELRIVSPDMGGAFGMRSNTYPEMALVLWAAKRLGRPVKWTATRSESFLSDDHGRDMILDVALGLDRDGNFLALKLENVADMGAYLSIFGPFPAFGNMGGLAGVYRTPKIAVAVKGVFTNTTPIGPYRGAGRPEAILALERAIDQAAQDLGIDRIALRRRNMIPADAMPFQTALTYKYDSGKFEENMDKALARADAAGFDARRTRAEKSAKLRGLGLANAIEQSAGLFDEGAEIRFDAGGNASVMMGLHSHGQGHETIFRQLLSDKLDLEFEQVRYVQGDTDIVPYGHGTFGSRSSGLGSGALARAADMIVEQGKRVAGHLLEAAAEDITFADGSFQVAGTDRSLALAAVARAALTPGRHPSDMDAGLKAFASFAHPAPTFPNGCHIAEVEIDRATGVVALVNYTVVCDVGTVMNPMLLEGQVHGGVVQGFGQIRLEEMVWQADSGQLLSGSLMDYCMPRADDLPFIQVETNPVPTPTNPFGIKGAGESGTVGAMPAVLNAIADALASAGAAPVAMPATPEKVWRALQP